MSVASNILASSDQRGAERVPTFLRVRLKFASVDKFIERYSTNVSMGGIFIQSRSPKPPGTTLRFEMALENGDPLIRGEGQVTWVREFDPNAPGQPFGMGVRFTRLDAQSRSIVERAVAHRQGSPTAGRGFTTSPPVREPRASQKRGRSAKRRRGANARPRKVSPHDGVDLDHIDAQLVQLMKEAGIDEDRVRRTASEAAEIARSADADLAELLRPPGSPPPLPMPKAPPETLRPPIPESGGRPPGTPPPLPVRASSPPPVPPEPTQDRSGRVKRGSRATPQPVAPAREPVDAEAEAAPTEKEAGSAFEGASSATEAAAFPDPASGGAVDEPAGEPWESLRIDAEASAQERQIPRRTPGLASRPLFDSADLEGADRMLESLQQPEPADERPVENLEMDATFAEQAEPVEDEEPPGSGDLPEEDPEVFPDRELVPPPPEATGPLFEVDAEPEETSLEAADGEAETMSAAERWAAATGPETANLEAELDGAMEAVIERTPPPVTSKPRRKAKAPAGRPKGKKGILGRIFNKKK